MRRAVLFDFDGTLGETMQGHLCAWNAALLPFHIKLEKHEYFPLEGMGMRELAVKFTHKLSLSNNQIDEIVEQKKRFYKSQNKVIKYFDGVEFLLNKLKFKYQVNQHGYHSNYKFSTNLIYLGYLEEDVATSYMENIFNKLLTQLTNNITELECEYTHFTVSSDNTYYKVSLEFKDVEDKLNKVILPYLYQEGVKPIYPNRIMQKPKIELLYVNKAGISYFEKRNFFMKPPDNKFNLDYLTLIKGTPVVARAGTPSVHDQMNLEEIEKYKYYFKKANSINLIKNANLSNARSNNSMITHNNISNNNNQLQQSSNNQEQNQPKQNNNNNQEQNQSQLYQPNVQNQSQSVNNKNKNTHTRQFGYFL
jgi:hypothetical protein